MAAYSKKIITDNIMTEKDKDHYRDSNIRRFCEKEIYSDKVRVHCLSTGEYRGPAQQRCKFNVTQKRSNFIPLVFDNFNNYDCHLFFKQLLDKRNDKVKLDKNPKTKEE